MRLTASTAWQPLTRRADSVASNSFRASLAGARRTASTNLAFKPVPKSTSFAVKAPSISDGNAFASARSRSEDRAKVEEKRKVKEQEKDALARRYDDVFQAQEAGAYRRDEEVTIRNDDLTLAVKLPLGPIHHRAPPSDLLFNHLEPNSGVRLSSRLISHPDLQDHLAERYILRGPGELYGAARRVRGRNEWEVPVTGDWVVFGVLAERSGIRYTNTTGNRSQAQEEAPTQGGDDDEEAFLQEGEEESGKGKKKKAQANATKEQSSRRYLIFKLLDLGTRTSSSASNPTSTSSSYVNVFLFESSTETSDHLDSETAVRTKTYAGGSGGAYESLWKEQGGAVVAILNPRIMPPKSSGPNSSDGDVLSITPESSASVLVVGRAKDLGSCRALRRDTGKECGGWVDLRTCGGGDAVCEWHVKRQVGKVRAGRAELFIGTGGMQTHTGAKFTAKSMKAGGKGAGGKGAGYDPVNKTGLLPDKPVATSINGSVVRVVGGSAQPSVYTTSTSHTRFTSKRSSSKNDGPPRQFDEALDQEKETAARLQRKKAQEEREMKKMLEGDQKKGGSMGSKYLEQAERVRLEMKKKAEAKAAAAKGKGKGKGKAPVPVAKKRPAPAEDSASAGNSADDESLPCQPKRKRPFSAAVVRAIGFDPTLSHLCAPADRTGEIKAATREAAMELLDGPGERKVDLEFPEGERRRRSGVDVRRLGGKEVPARTKVGSRRKEVVAAAVRAAAGRERSEEEEEESDDDLVIEPKPPVRALPFLPS